MKKLILYTLLILTALAAVAFAGDKMIYDNKSTPKVPIQNLGALAPVKGKSRCDTVTGTKGTFKTYTAVGYLGVDMEVVDSAGAAVPVKWKLDGAQVSVGPKFSFTNAGATTYSTAAYEPYSSTSRALTSCRRGQ